jgi:GT2 family glycosyltransferase
MEQRLVLEANPSPDLTIVLVTWNGLEVTAAALDSIRSHAFGITYEVIVVDNGSTKDATVTELPARFPWVTFIANGTNLGFTRANNQGIRRSRGRYVLLLNSDTVQTQNALGAAVRYMDAHPDVGALGILHKNNDAGRSFQPSFFPFPNATGATRALLGLGRKTSPAPIVVEQDVDWVCGSFLMIRRECLDQVGLLDERYFAYQEDVDWCLQAQRAGWKVRFWPGVSMIHLGSVAAPHLRDKTGLMIRSQLTYLSKNHGRPAAVAFYLAMAARLGVGLCRHAVGSALLGRRPLGIRQRWDRLVSLLLVRAASATSTQSGLNRPNAPRP